MGGSMNFAVAFLLADALAVAVSVQLGRINQRGDAPTAVDVRFFLLILALLAVIAIGFESGLIACVFLAYLLRKSHIASAPA